MGKKKIYLFCSQGMSTSMLAQNMQDVANENNFPVEVKAFSHGELQKIMDELNPDVIMLGPQVKYLYDETIKQFGHLGKPILMINAEDYGVMNGAKVLKQALIALKQNKS